MHFPWYVLCNGQPSGLIYLFHNIFPLAVSSPNTMNLWVITNNYRLYSTISQILLVYETWWWWWWWWERGGGDYNKFASTKSLGVCYWCVQIPQCGYIRHGLKIIMFYVQNHIAVLPMCQNQTLFQDRSLGAPASVKLVYYLKGGISHSDEYRCGIDGSSVFSCGFRERYWYCCYFTSVLVFIDYVSISINYSTYKRRFFTKQQNTM